ncbi:MAG: hypothetical protein U0840_19570 [Gemmataceae bacterium]
MRRCGISALLFLVGLAPGLQAGVHNLDESHPFMSLDEARGYLLRVRSAALPVRGTLQPESFKAAVLGQVERLEARKRDGLFTTIDRVSLSACYLRLGGDRAADAVRLLSAGERDHFLIQSNLAAAYFLSGELSMAIRHQERALALWPELYAPWPQQQLRFLRECELVLLRLYRSRLEESRGGPSRGEVEVDPIFPGVRYVGSSGEYEAGGLATESRDRLPANAFNLLYQIAVWFPTDMRLYWQIGEMLNAFGVIDQAHDVFVELVEAGMSRSFRNLPLHRRVLLEARPVFQAWNKPESKGMLLSEFMLIPRASFAAPGLGDAAMTVAGLTAAVMAPRLSKETISLTSPIQAGGGGGDAPIPLNLQHVMISFGFGFLVAVLCGLQWQEWRRRRQARRSAEEPVAMPRLD